MRITSEKDIKLSILLDETESRRLLEILKYAKRHEKANRNSYNFLSLEERAMLEHMINNILKEVNK